MKWNSLFCRVAITMTISAFWHGIYPGYYLSFLLVPLILIAEDNMRAAFRHGSPRRIQCFDWACWFFKMRGFDYMCMGFLLLRLDYTLTYWRSIFFWSQECCSGRNPEENKPKLNELFVDMYVCLKILLCTWINSIFFIHKPISVVVVVACVLQKKISNQSTKHNITIITDLFINRGH